MFSLHEDGHLLHERSRGVYPFSLEHRSLWIISSADTMSLLSQHRSNEYCRPSEYDRSMSKFFSKYCGLKSFLIMRSFFFFFFF